MRFLRGPQLAVSLAVALVPISLAASGPASHLPAASATIESHPETAHKLHGRFLHISDIHPDPFYEAYSSTEKDDACHRGNGPAGVYGAETSDCDSPPSLVNATFKWIEENIKDSIDFVIWTGDSARHDNDERIPRTEKQVVDQNKMIVDKFYEVFGRSDNVNDTDPTNDLIIPIIPTFGNNDIMPHNIFLPGPNRWTSEFLDIWRYFIPEAQRHQFQRGGWFYTEAIPNKLAVFSLNTMYFFASNGATDGCARRTEPGYEHFEWLRIQLQIMRDRGMKAMLIGHVPPARTANKQSWDETCWQKYNLWLQQYRDVIVGSFFGHMNLDHFMLQDSRDVELDVVAGMRTPSPRAPLDADTDLVSIMSASDYLSDLKQKWSKLPSPKKSKRTLEQGDSSTSPSIGDGLGQFISEKPHRKKKGKKGKKGHKDKGSYLDQIGGPWAERYSLSLVQGSVVPNYFPTLRIFEYNITGLGDIGRLSKSQFSRLGAQIPLHDTTHEPHTVRGDEKGDDLASNPAGVDAQGKKKKKKNKPKDPKHRFTVPKGPSKTAPPGPAYSSQSLSLISYTQYFANLTRINNDFHPQSLDDAEKFLSEKWSPGKHEGRVPHGGKDKHPQPAKFSYEVEYNTANDKVYKLRDLTVKSYMELARRIGKSKGNINNLGSEPEGKAGQSAGNKSKKDKKGKKGGKEHKKHPKKGTNEWMTFVRRAFVGAVKVEATTADE